MGDILNAEVLEESQGSMEKPQLPAVSGVMATSSIMDATTIENAQRATAEVLSRVMVAQAVPRNKTALLNEMVALCADKTFAESAVYIKPAGKEKIKDPKTGRVEWIETYAEGPSVHLAREIASRYPNFEWNIIELSRKEGVAQVEVNAWDIQYNTRNRQTKTIPIPDWAAGKLDREDTVIKAKTAIVERNVLFAILPKKLVQICTQLCLEVQDKTAIELDKDKEVWIPELAKELNIGIDKLLEFVNVTSVDKCKLGDIKRLRQLKNGILAGDIDPEDVFPGAKQIATEETKAEAKQQKEAVKNARASRQKAEAPKGEESPKTQETATPAASAEAAPTGDTSSIASSPSKPKTEDPQPEPEPVKPVESQEPEPKAPPEPPARTHERKQAAWMKPQ